jgi:hypothetical protein
VPHASVASAPKPSYAIESVEQKKDPVFQAYKNGFQPGAMIKSAHGKDRTLYTIESVTVGFIDAVQATHKESKESVRISMDELYASWRVSKRKLDASLPRYSKGNACCPITSIAWQFEAIKGVIMHCLFEHYSAHKDDVDNVICYMGTRARAAKRYAVGELQLAPASMRLDKKQSSKCVFVATTKLNNGTDIDFYWGSHVMPPLDKDWRPQDKAWISQFWFVDATQTKKHANMQIFWTSTSVGSVVVHLPLMKNTVVLEKSDELKRFIPTDSSACVPAAAVKRQKK